MLLWRIHRTRCQQLIVEMILEWNTMKWGPVSSDLKWILRMTLNLIYELVTTLMVFLKMLIVCQVTPVPALWRGKRAPPLPQMPLVCRHLPRWHRHQRGIAAVENRERRDERKMALFHIQNHAFTNITWLVFMRTSDKTLTAMWRGLGFIWWACMRLWIFFLIWATQKREREKNVDKYF